jgi:hypothetical protein
MVSRILIKIRVKTIKMLFLLTTVFQLELRKRVERLVREYLCMVTQDRKFVSGTTGDIILNSAR